MDLVKAGYFKHKGMDSLRADTEMTPYNFLRNMGGMVHFYNKA